MSLNVSYLLAMFFILSVGILCILPWQCNPAVHKLLKDWPPEEDQGIRQPVNELKIDVTSCNMMLCYILDNINVICNI